jgi:hypothetical protein
VTADRDYQFTAGVSGLIEMQGGGGHVVTVHAIVAVVQDSAFESR